MEGCMEASKCGKLPRYVRYPLLAITVLFFAAVIGLLFVAGFLALRENTAAGVLLLLLGVSMLAACIADFRKAYFAKAGKKK